MNGWSGWSGCLDLSRAETPLDDQDPVLGVVALDGASEETASFGPEPAESIAGELPDPLPIRSGVVEHRCRFEAGLLPSATFGHLVRSPLTIEEDDGRHQRQLSRCQSRSAGALQRALAGLEMGGIPIATMLSAPALLSSQK